jgi:hypothetical protein
MLMGKTAVEGWQNTKFLDGDFSDWEIEAEQSHMLIRRGPNSQRLDKKELIMFDNEIVDSDCISDDNSVDDEMQ